MSAGNSEITVPKVGEPKSGKSFIEFTPGQNDSEETDTEEPQQKPSSVKLRVIKAEPDPVVMPVTRNNEFLTYKSMGSSDRSTKSTTLIIKVNKEHIMAYKDGKLDLDGLMKKAEITQY